MIDILVALLILGAVLAILQLVPIDATIKRIIYILVILFVVLWVLSLLTGYSIPMRFRH